MRVRLLTCLAILGIAFIVEFFLSGAGIYINVVFATLISMAFVLDPWELLFATLASVFILNWQPAASPEIFMIGLFPFVAYFFQAIFRWQKWTMSTLAILVGLSCFYALASMGGTFPGTRPFLLDLVAVELFAAIFFLSHNQWENT